jgi:hypothetical protein
VIAMQRPLPLAAEERSGYALIPVAIRSTGTTRR